jgi:hypothetical protein
MEKPKHRGPPRPLSVLKQNEYRQQVNEMLVNNVIQPSEAAEYSHPLLTPKPDKSWRFCVDYRQLNDCCESSGWPIPNIEYMTQRLGNKKGKFSLVSYPKSGLFITGEVQKMKTIRTKNKSTLFIAVVNNGSPKLFTIHE